MEFYIKENAGGYIIIQYLLAILPNQLSLLFTYP